MNLQRPRKYKAEVSTASMNDIMFFLMLFFLIMSTLLNPNVINLSLPKSKQNTKLLAKEVRVSITKDLKYYVGNTPVEFKNLESTLSVELSKSKDATVILNVDNALSVQDLVDVLQIGNKLKVKMVLATKAPTP
ncbi:MAG: biopolymer transporter ExbD [Bacteroidota bacterium]